MEGFQVRIEYHKFNFNHMKFKKIFGIKLKYKIFIV